MKKLMIITLTGILVFGVACGKAEDVADDPELANGENGVDETSGEKPLEEQPTLVCLAENLNIHAKPGTASNVVGSISRGELVSFIGDEWGENSPDDPSGYTYWLNVRLSDGTEGWVARMFVMDYEAFKQLEEIDRAAKTSDSAKTETAIKAFIDKTEEVGISGNEYTRSSDGKKFALACGIGGYIVTVGYGVSSQAPLGKYETLGEWIYDSKYWSVHTYGRFDIYDADSVKKIFGDTYPSFGGEHQYVEEPEILVWISGLNDRKIEYPLMNGPITESNSLSNIDDKEYYSPGDYGYIESPCLMVYEFTTGNSYMVAAPDLTTLSKHEEEDDYYSFVILKPTERFAATPLFGPVSEMEIYKNNVGKPVHATLSQE